MTVNQEVERPTITRSTGRPGRWWALAALALAGLTIGIQSTVFVPNAGLAVVGAAAVAVFVPEARRPRPVALDVPGAVLSSAALAGVIYGFINAGQHGWGSVGTMRQVGGTIGVAVRGTVLSSGYRGRAQTGHLPAALASATRDSVAAGIAVARQLHDTDLAQVVRAAFVHGMDLTLIVSGAIVAVGAVLAALFLPRRNTSSASGQPATREPATGQPADSSQRRSQRDRASVNGGHDGK